MADAKGPARDALDPADRELWDFADRADAEKAQQAFEARFPAGADGKRNAPPRARMILALAWQNAGKHDRAGALLDGVAADAGQEEVLQIWRRAEKIYALRKRPDGNHPATDLKETEAALLAGSDDPFVRFTGARALLALGLVATQENRFDQAQPTLERALELMTEAGSEAGLAIAEADLGRLLTWRGNVGDARSHLEKGIAIWNRINPTASGDVWHDLGYLLFDTGHAAEAVPAFSRAYELNGSSRSQTGLATALIGAGKLREAWAATQEVIAREDSVAETARKSNSPSPGVYRKIIAQRCIGELALQGIVGAEGTNDAVEATSPAQCIRRAEAALAAGVALVGETCSREDPIFPRWAGMLAKENIETPGKGRTEYSKLEMVKLELLIMAQRRPGGAGRHCDRLAEVFATRGEYLLEVRARKDAAVAFEKSGDKTSAIGQIELALRTINARAAAPDLPLSSEAQGLADALRAQLENLSRGAGVSQPKVPAVGPDRKIGMATVSIERTPAGQLVRQHQFEVRGQRLEKLARDALFALRPAKGAVRVLSGLPTIIPPLGEPAALPAADGKPAGIKFDILVECAVGRPLTEAIKRRPRTEEETRQAVRIIRDLASAIEILHGIGLTDVRPQADLVLLDQVSRPIYLDILPLHANERRAAESDVKDLVRMLARWLAGGWLLPQSVVFWPRFRLSYFGSNRRVPPGLDEFLGDALGNPKTLAAWRPGALADRLQEFC